MTNGLHIRLLGEPPMPPPDADFAFTIDFAKGTGDPRRVFDAAILLIDGFEALDGAVATSVDSQIKTLMVLEDIEAGSLKVWIRNLLERIDDRDLREGEWKRIVGKALAHARIVVLEFLNDEKADAGAAIDLLRRELQQIAEDTNVKHLPAYPPIHEAKLIGSMDALQEAKRALGPGDKLKIETDERVFEVDLSQTWEPSEVVPEPPDLLETESIGTIILTIRKAAMLGDAMWQFGHGKITISAKILDEQWLEDFHDRKIPLFSGDALKCDVRWIYGYDETGTLIETKLEIIKVIQVIGGGSGPQLTLPI